jgi:hypothetical protein
LLTSVHAEQWGLPAGNNCCVCESLETGYICCIYDCNDPDHNCCGG